MLNSDYAGDSFLDDLVLTNDGFNLSLERFLRSLPAANIHTSASATAAASTANATSAAIATTHMNTSISGNTPVSFAGPTEACSSTEICEDRLASGCPGEAIV